MGRSRRAPLPTKYPPRHRRDQILDLRRVPVRGANATVTSGAPDRLRIVCAVNPDPGFVQAHPENADRIVRTGRQIEVIVRAHAVVEHAFVMPKPGQRRDAEDFPHAFRRGQFCRTRRDRKLVDQRVLFANFQCAFDRVDDDAPICESRIGRNKTFLQFLDLEWNDVRHFHRVTRFQFLDVHSRVEFLHVFLRGMETLRHKFRAANRRATPLTWPVPTASTARVRQTSHRPV